MSNLDWATRIIAGDLRALARAATAVENHQAGWEELGAELGRKHPLALGVTGAPGAGNGTRVGRLGAAELEGAIHGLGSAAPIVRTVATEGTGIDDLIAAIARVPQHDRSGGGSLRIDHLGVAVRSIDDALNFYAGMLGMQVSLREIV